MTAAPEPGALHILRYPDASLREATCAVDSVTPDLVALAEQMVAAMRAAEGIGLAAPQIGRREKIIVVDTTAGEKPPLLLANPQVAEASKQINRYEEGCLSIPGITAEIARPAQVVVSALNLQTAQMQSYWADGLFATCLQHEIDHLNGVLFIDHLSRLKRYRLMRQYGKNEPTKLPAGARPEL